MLKTWAFYDATGGGAMIIVPNSGSSLTVQEDVEWVGYAAVGATDLDEIVMTVTGDMNWEASGLRLPNTYNGEKAFTNDAVHWFSHKVPLKANSVMAFTSVAGAGPCYLLMYVDDGIGPRFMPPAGPGQGGRAMLVTLNSTASGANTTASTAQMLYATTTITAFTQPRVYRPIAVARAAAATGPALFVGISKGNDQHVTWWPLEALVDGCEEWLQLPASGLPDFKSGERCNIHWLSDATEQPTAAVTFAYSA